MSTYEIWEWDLCDSARCCEMVESGEAPYAFQAANKARRILSKFEDPEPSSKSHMAVIKPDNKPLRLLTVEVMPIDNPGTWIPDRYREHAAPGQFCVAERVEVQA